MRTLTEIVVALLLLGGSASLQGPRPQDVAMQAAIRTETIDGNLDKAIEQYTAITTTFGDDRAIVATALLHLAGCHQRRGDAQARSVYQRILRDFADQTAAANVARARLGSGPTAANAEMTYKRVWPENANDDGDNTAGMVSPDGRYLSFVDWKGGDLMLRDLTNNTSRRLTGDGKWPQSGEYAERSAISRDGTQIAYAWFDGKDRYQLRVGDLRGASMQARTIVDVADVGWLVPHDWSPEGRFIAATMNRRARSAELVVVNTADGTIRTVKPTDWVGTSHACFSPDGRFLAFDEAVGTVGSDERDVVVVDLADGKEHVVAPHAGLDRVAAWSPDGSSLLFTSERGGSLSLWSQQLNNGVPAAGSTPRLIKTEIGAKSLGMTARGSLYTAQQVAGRNIFVAEVDFKTGTILRPAERAPGRYVGLNEWPDWSRDGKFLSHLYARNWAGRSPTIAITALDGSGTREIPLRVNNGRVPLWAPDGKSLVTHGVNLEGRSGIYSIDARDGSPRLIVEADPDGFYGQPEYSPDGRKLYFVRRQKDDAAIMELDLESGRTRELLRDRFVRPAAVSPDGRMVATIVRDDKSSVAIVVSLVDGSKREVVRVAQPQALGFNVSWAPDSDGLLVSFLSGEERRETWLVPVAGGPHKVLDLPGYGWGRIRVHPDGKRVAYHSGSLKYEVWVLENFLPR